MINVGDTIIADAFNSFTYYISGDYFLALFVLLGFLFFLGLMFRINLEWLSIFLVPIVIYFMSIEPSFYPVGGLILVFVGFVIIKNFWFKPR